MTPPAEGAPPPSKDKSPEAVFGKFLPFLQTLSNLVLRGQRVVHNLVDQLACLYHERQKLYTTTFVNVSLDPVFDALGVLLRVFFTLDQIIRDNPAIENGWSAYRRMIKYVRADPERYGMDQEKLVGFQNLMMQLDKTVLSGKVLEGVLDQDFGLEGAASAKVLVASNRVLFDQFKNYIKTTLPRLTAALEEPVETYERLRIVSLSHCFIWV